MGVELPNGGMVTSKEPTGWRAERLMSAVVSSPMALVVVTCPLTVAGKIAVSGTRGIFPIDRSRRYLEGNRGIVSKRDGLGSGYHVVISRGQWANGELTGGARGGLGYDSVDIRVIRVSLLGENNRVRDGATGAPIDYHPA